MARLLTVLLLTGLSSAIIALVSLRTPEVRAATAEELFLAVLEKPIALGHLEEAVNSALFTSV